MAPNTRLVGDDSISEQVITLDGGDEQRMQIFGRADGNLRIIREALGVKLFARGPTIKLVGDAEAVGKAAALIESLQDKLKHQPNLTEEDVTDSLAELSAGNDQPQGDIIQVYRKSVTIRPRTDGQKHYTRAIAEHDLCICLGPAGTGKTYLAVAMALSLLKTGKIKRIILARPAVEAGERLGYLPGDLQAKVNPYLRPIYDAMHDMMEYDQFKQFIKNDVIEVVPLAFMRGRTLNLSAVILDEAQNATRQQMLMFLTRLGHHSKMIVTGDDSQSDLDGSSRSGLVDASHRLKNTEGVAIVRLLKTDIVRHSLVTRIVHAYGDPADADSNTT